MKKIILLLILVFVVFVVWNRNRLYLRDPLGTVTRDGVKEAGAQVYINFNDDVLVIQENAPSYWFVVQHQDHVGTPQTMKGMHWIAYLADADVVPLLVPDTSAVVDSMTGKAVTFHDGKHATVIALR